MQNTKITNSDSFLDEVKINLNVLGSLMLNWIGGHVDCTDVVAIHHCGVTQGGVKLLNEME